VPVTPTPILLQSTVSEEIQNPATANTNRDGSTGTYSSSFAFGANGGLLESVTFTAPGTTTAGFVRIFYASDGSTFRLVGEVPVTAITPSGTVAAFTATWLPPDGLPMPVKANGAVKFNMHNAEAMNCHIKGGNY
jgi:hypothetical protein